MLVVSYGLFFYAIFMVLENNPYRWSFLHDNLLTIVLGIAAGIGLLVSQAVHLGLFLKNETDIQTNEVLQLSVERSFLNLILPLRFGLIYLLAKTHKKVSKKTLLEFYVVNAITTIFVASIITLLLINRHVLAFLLVVLSFATNYYVGGQYQRFIKINLLYLSLSFCFIFMSLYVILSMNFEFVDISLVIAGTLMLNILSVFSITPGNLGVREFAIAALYGYFENFSSVMSFKIGVDYFFLRLISVILLVVVIRLLARAKQYSS